MLSLVIGMALHGCAIVRTSEILHQLKRVFCQLNVSFSKQHNEVILIMLPGARHAFRALHALISVIISTL